jgi:hypothetical protein
MEFSSDGWPQESPDTPHRLRHGGIEEEGGNRASRRRSSARAGQSSTPRPDVTFCREIYGNGKLRLRRPADDVR